MAAAPQDLTSALAIVAGCYALAGGIALNRTGHRLDRLLDEFEGSQALSHLSGLAIFACGAGMLLAHNVWTGALAMIVTLLGWIGLVKGLVLIAWPAPIWVLGRAMARPAALRVFKLATPAAGLALIGVGLAGLAR